MLMPVLSFLELDGKAADYQISRDADFARHTGELSINATGKADVAIDDSLFLQPLWSFILAHGQPYVSHWAFAGSLSIVTYVLVCIYFSYLDLTHSVSTKVQKDYWPTVAEMQRAAIPQLLAYGVFHFLSWGMFFMFPQYWLLLPAQAPTVLQFLKEVSLSLVAGDFLIYWEHRLMHMIPYTRNHIHSVHHEYSAPFSWAGGWVHPAEDAVVVVCQVLPSVFVFGVHPFSLWVFAIIWVMCLVDEHSGHDVWWSPYRLLPFTGCPLGGGAAPHDIHHYKVYKNYGFVFCVWDILFGTFEPVAEETCNPFVPPFVLERRPKKEVKAD
jgi:sterol desaturase/sphingolipid hydroxylase (fatty acid hydroxylase superfamily)